MIPVLFSENCSSYCFLCATRGFSSLMCLHQHSTNMFSNSSGRFLDLFHYDALASSYSVTQTLSISEFYFLCNPGETTMLFHSPYLHWGLETTPSNKLGKLVSTLLLSLFSGIILIVSLSKISKSLLHIFYLVCYLFTEECTNSCSI